MRADSSQRPPKLQPPGAGLPFTQRLAIRLWIGPVVSRRTPRQQTRAIYEKVTRSLIESVSQVPLAQRNTPVLVDPMVGLEDSSRFWSLNGVLEHLMLVSRGIEGAVLSLSSGQAPDLRVDIAQLKPAQKGSDLLEEFARFAPGLLERIDQRLAEPGMNVDSPLTLRHPWFGEFTARQWYWLLGTHQAIHRKQARGIIRGLGR